MSQPVSYPRVAALKTAPQFLARLAELGVALPFDDQVAAGDTARWRSRPRPAAWRRAIASASSDGGLDGTAGRASVRSDPPALGQLRPAAAPALIWGGEAFAVRTTDAPTRTSSALGPHAEADLVSLRTHLVEEHPGAPAGAMASSSACSSPTRAATRGPTRADAGSRCTAYAHPGARSPLPRRHTVRTFTDAELDTLTGDFVRAAIVARAAGFDFVDVKHCHGYLGHELLSAWNRPGPYGGAAGRTTFLRRIVEGIRRDAPGLAIGVRVSAFDAVPFRKDAAAWVPRSRTWRPIARLRTARRPVGGPRSRAGPRLPARARSLGIRWVSVSAGSPYYNPHIQRPALFPPSDGYLPPEIRWSAAPVRSPQSAR
jgi:hypothetical protein